MYIWPFCRLGGMFTAMAVIGTRSVPMRIRLVLALAVVAIIAPVLPAMPQVPLFSLQSAVIIAQEVMIGLAFGFITRIFSEVFVLSGQLISLQTGLGFASLVDPNNGASVPVVGQAFLIIVTLVFLALDGHLLCIRMLVESFHTIPVSPEALAQIDFSAATRWGSWLFAAGVVSSLSAVLALLMLNLAFGVLTRAAPQLNLFVIGFPMTMVVGLILLWMLLADMPLQTGREFTRMQELSCEFLYLDC